MHQLQLAVLQNVGNFIFPCCLCDRQESEQSNDRLSADTTWRWKLRIVQKRETPCSCDCLFSSETEYASEKQYKKVEIAEKRLMITFSFFNETQALVL